MKTEISKRKIFGLGLALAGIILFAGTEAPAQIETESFLAPELVMPVVNKNTKIHISGSFTLTANNVNTGQIEIRGLLRLMEKDGLLSMYNLTLTGSNVAVCPSEPSGRRLAFSVIIDTGASFGDVQGDLLGSASLFLDATTAAERAGRQPRASLGWFTAVAYIEQDNINGNQEGFAPYVVQLGQPQRDSYLKIK